MDRETENDFGAFDGVLDGEIARIRAAQETSEHDKEDLISYAKHVLALRDRIEDLELELDLMWDDLKEGR